MHIPASCEDEVNKNCCGCTMRDWAASYMFVGTPSSCMRYGHAYACVCVCTPASMWPANTQTMSFAKLHDEIPQALKALERTYLRVRHLVPAFAGHLEACTSLQYSMTSAYGCMYTQTHIHMRYMPDPMWHASTKCLRISPTCPCVQPGMLIPQEHT